MPGFYKRITSLLSCTAPQFDGNTPNGEMPVPDQPPPEMNPVAGYEGAGFTAGGKF